MEHVQTVLDAATILNLAYPLAIGISGLGCGIGMGLIWYAGLTTLGRQPELSGKVMLFSILGTVFVETLTIYAIASKFLL
jgi:F-type H+-transporting ATPase subunit c